MVGSNSHYISLLCYKKSRVLIQALMKILVSNEGGQLDSRYQSDKGNIAIKTFQNGNNAF